MSSEKNNPWQMVQTFLLAATAAGVFLSVGRRDRDIEHNSTSLLELRSISMDLVKSQVLSEANDSTHTKTLNELKIRLDILEQR
tara:strand:+ start:302 stop:553 length:252 start_codon:yes stop_codon:yes gene_type:complete